MREGLCPPSLSCSFDDSEDGSMCDWHNLQDPNNELEWSVTKGESNTNEDAPK